jgi:Zn-dependent protease
MIKPEVLPRDYDSVKLATVFDAPMVVVPHPSALPANQIIVSVGLAYWAKSRYPERPWRQQVFAGVLSMLVTLGSEWAHNMAHAYAARLVGKPVDAIRVVFGMPLLVYRDLNDETITPQQHIIRGLGGPLLNLLLTPLARFWQIRARPGTVGRDAADAALAMNIFLLFAGLQPIPGLDGGVLLKWALVDRGQSIPQADENVRKANWISGSLLAIGSALSFMKRRRWIGSLLGMLAGISVLVAKGWLKES